MLERDKDTPPLHSPSHSEGTYVCNVYTHYLLIFPRIKKRGGGFNCISLCFVHFIEGYCLLMCAPGKKGCSRIEGGCCTPLPPFEGNTTHYRVHVCVYM